MATPNPSPAGPKRRIVVVDVEASGLRGVDFAVEVAWHDLTTGDTGVFIPAHDVDWVRDHGQPDALELNGYWDRIANAQQDDGREALRFHHVLRGQTFAAANPTFDTRMLWRLFLSIGQKPDPYSRTLDLLSYAAAVLGLHPADLPGTAAVCDALNITPGTHAAASDVAAEVACFLTLMAKAGVSPDG